MTHSDLIHGPPFSFFVLDLGSKDDDVPEKWKGQKQVKSNIINGAKFVDNMHGMEIDSLEVWMWW